MSTGMLSLQNCPRSVEELKSLQRGVRYRLAMQLGMFADDSQEMAFNGATDDQQCEALASGLSQWDQNRGAAGGSPEQQMQLPPQQPPQMQMQMPAQQQMQPPMQQVAPPPQQQYAPQMGTPQFAPPQQQIQPPPQQQFQPQFAPPQGMPSMGQPPQQQPSMGMPPAITPPAAAPPPRQPQPPQQMAPAPQPPVAPAPVMQPARQPTTPADPGNQGGAALPILRGMADTLKALAEANGTNQKWLEQLHEQSLGHAKMFEILLTMFLVFCEQQGINPQTMAGLCKQVTDEQRGLFLSKLDPQGKG